MRLRLLSGADIRRALPMPEAVAAMKEAFATISGGTAVAPPRAVLSVPDREATVLLMGGCVPGHALTGKTVAIFQRNRERGLPVVQGLLQVMDPESGTPQALMDGGALTAWRTGAAGGAAADLLARQDARTAALIGCGAQAETQLLALDTVRELDEVRVCGRRESSARDFATRLQPAVQARLVAVSDAARALRGADLVVTATNSIEPVFDGTQLEPGCHITGVGSFTPWMRELDEATVVRAHVFIDHRAAALAEAGDLIAAVRAGRSNPDDWSELGEVVLGHAPGRREPGEITLFKSVGHAVQDAVAGERIRAAAERLGLGRAVEI